MRMSLGQLFLKVVWADEWICRNSEREFWKND